MAYIQISLFVHSYDLVRPHDYTFFSLEVGIVYKH